MSMSMSNHIYIHGVKADKVKVEVTEGRIWLTIDGEGGSYLWATLFSDEVVEVVRKLGSALVNH